MKVEKTTQLHDVRATALRVQQSWSLITTVTLSDPQRLLLWWDKIQKKKKSINTVMDRKKRHDDKWRERFWEGETSSSDFVQFPLRGHSHFPSFKVMISTWIMLEQDGGEDQSNAWVNLECVASDQMRVIAVADSVPWCLICTHFKHSAPHCKHLSNISFLLHFKHANIFLIFAFC